ncbi:hypothetical protein AXF42_Ash008983 [Apostasia shenzhenica]|uniref:Uncharacterized protein n=1 Tax=Apostasia shenzhenica TaxID=1088818 RepID=A0A2I0AT75_9ASPA|nr:hypothetical protein AXF42_Ash008983 [Apostasia shenzhenica]
MAVFSYPKHSSTINILWQSLTIFIKNPWSFLFTLLTLSSTFILCLSNYLSTNTILTSLSHNYITFSKLNPKSPEFGKLFDATLQNLRELTIIESIFIVASFIVSSLLTTSIIHMISMVYTEKQPTLQELVCRTKKSWKPTMITILYVAILSLTCGTLLLFLVGGFGLISVTSVAFGAASAVLALMALLLHLYLGMIWATSVAVAVLEEGCQGLAAVVRAADLIRGRRRQGVLIALLMLVIFCAVGVAHAHVLSHCHPSAMEKIWIEIIHIAVLSVVQLFMLAACTAFYYACKQNHEEMIISKGEVYYGLRTDTVDEEKA